jgi:hypothetical protein
MNQFGLNMPGGQMQRAPSMNLYTGLLALAVLALAAACVLVYLQNQKIGPGGSPFATHAYDPATKTFKVQLPK